MDPENDIQRVSQNYRSVAAQEFRVLGVIPVGSELIRGSDEERISFEGECFGGLEPRLKSLVWKLLTGAIEEEFPNLGVAE
jgi:hypothetical protein